MTPATLAAIVAAFGLQDMVAFVAALPRPTNAVLRDLLDDRVWAERWAHVPALPPLVVAPPVDLDELLTAEEAARELRVSLDTLYARVHRGELEPEPRVRGGRLKFRRANLRVTPVANGIGPRYIPAHDTTRGPSLTPPARLDTTRARGGPQRDRDDRRPMGARRAQHNTARRNEPYAPGQAAWAGKPPAAGPKGGGS